MMALFARLPILRTVAYGAYFVFAFVLFAYWTFPYERIAEHFARQFGAKSGYRITVEDVEPYWLTGVEVENAHIYAGPEDSVGMHILDGRARASLSTLLGSDQALSFDIRLATGSLEGEYEKQDGELSLDAQLQNVRLEMFPFISDAAGLPIAGAVSGSIDVQLNDEPDLSEGKVDLRIDGLRLGDGKAKLSLPGVPGLTVDPIEAGNLVLALQIADGNASIDALQTKGDDLELNGEGQVRLGKTLSLCRPNIVLRLRFTDAYRTKTPRTEAMFSLLEGSNNRQIQRAKGADGWYGFQLSGSLSAPRFTPGAPGAAAPKRRPLGGAARPAAAK